MLLPPTHTNQNDDENFAPSLHILPLSPYNPHTLHTLSLLHICTPSRFVFILARELTPSFLLFPYTILSLSLVHHQTHTERERQRRSATDERPPSPNTDRERERYFLKGLAEREEGRENSTKKNIYTARVGKQKGDRNDSRLHFERERERDALQNSFASVKREKKRERNGSAIAPFVVVRTECEVLQRVHLDQ